LSYISGLISKERRKFRDIHAPECKIFSCYLKVYDVVDFYILPKGFGDLRLSAGSLVYLSINLKRVGYLDLSKVFG
jgi:hypothetical protein